MRAHAAATAGLIVLVALASCTLLGGSGIGAKPTRAQSPPASDQPLDSAPGQEVIRVSYGTAMYPSLEASISTLPIIAIYADGRVFSTDYRLRNLMTVQVRRIWPADVQRLVDFAVAVRVGEPAPDSGVMVDVPETVFTVVSATGVKTTKVAFEEVQDVRQKQLQSLLDKLMDLPKTLGATAVSPPRTYVPARIAAVMKRTTPTPEGAHSALHWPGPTADYDPNKYQLVCFTLTGNVALEVHATTRGLVFARFWSTKKDYWYVALRPLLPNESGCSSLPQNRAVLNIR